MSRHLNNMRRLLRKLQLRYGEDDPLVLPLRLELEAREALASTQKPWSMPYREFIRSGASRFADQTSAPPSGSPQPSR